MIKHWWIMFRRRGHNAQVGAFGPGDYARIGVDVSRRAAERMVAQGLATYRRGPWPLIMRPAAYLDRYPVGPHADLARDVLGRKG